MRLSPIAICLLMLGTPGGASAEDGRAPAPPSGDVAGSWSVREAVDAESCGEGTYGEEYTLSITQDGNDLSITIGDETFRGKISGNVVRWSGEYPDDDGTTSATVQLTVGDDGTTLSGTSTWSWTDGSDSCSGTSELRGRKS